MKALLEKELEKTIAELADCEEFEVETIQWLEGKINGLKFALSIMPEC